MRALPSRLLLASLSMLAGLACASAQTAPSPASPPAAATASEAAVPAQRVPVPRRGKPVPAKVLFGAAREAAPLAARAIGFYSRGCLAGAKPLAADGPAWQAMRLSRNRYWAHPNLVGWVERFAVDAQQVGWPGLLVGDLSQPRGGPMLTGHASHQIGLDADIWLTPMPDRRLSRQEREELAATSMLAADRVSVDAQVWRTAHVGLIRRAALYPEVERILVHPAIKKALCLGAGTDRAWLGKVRPYWGHHYHMHVRIVCPSDSPTCQGQKPPAGDDGCGREVDDWLKIMARPPKPEPPSKKPVEPKREMTLDQLPAECRVVLDAGTAMPTTSSR